MFPRKLYVETTTRCNMQCGMCVKHVSGSSISNKHLDFELYRRIMPGLPHLEALVLNGIGEPLLHPDLARMVALARSAMPPESWIGFQTNGLLLTADITERLLAAGLNRLCISVDGPASESPCCGSLIHRHDHAPLSPVELVRGVREKNGHTNFQLGAEIVLLKETIAQLPVLVAQLADTGVDFILVSHLLAYHSDAEQQSLFNSRTAESYHIYQKWQDIARKEGLNITDLTARTWISARKPEEHRLQQLYREMLAEAAEQGLWLHARKLEEWDLPEMEKFAGYLEEAKAVAARNGVDISLPPLSATTERSCRFMEQGALFVDVEGDVMPCHPLWHSHTIHMDSEPKHLTRRVFGSIINQDILAIWQSPDYREFRKAVLNYDYPFCHSCSLGPCPDITGETTPFINDCFGTAVPCGHCLWCFDGIRCL